MSFKEIVRATNNKNVSLTEHQTEALISRLKSYRKKALVGQEQRESRARKGARLRAGDHWTDGIAQGRTAIVANEATALYERLIASVTRNKPVPEVHAKNDDDEAGADLIRSAIIENWETTGMQSKIKQGLLQSGFTNPVLLYVSWEQKKKLGIGDFNTRLIPSYRSIIDNRFADTNDMEFVGFKEKATRAKLTELYPDKADEIEFAASDTSSVIGKKGSSNPLDLQGKSGGMSSFADSNSFHSKKYGPPTGRFSINTGKDTASKNPMADEVEIEYLWIDDPTPKKEQKPKIDDLGRPVKKFVRNENGEIDFDVEGYEVVNGPFGPMYQPNIKPKREQVFEEVITWKYKNRRHIAWLPSDEIILWDVDWTGPIPLVCMRDNYALDGYWTEGLALRLASLQFARNVIFTMILEKIKYSLSGTYLATPRSGLKGNKLVPKPGQVFQANDISETAIKRFPVESIDPGAIQMVSIIDSEMMKILGVAPVSQGEAAGRADSPATYDKLLEAASGSIIDIAQMLEETLRQWCNIAMYYIQNYYTHEHFVEVETPEGITEWKAASALETQGQYSVRIETGSMLSQSEAAQFDRAAKLLGMGIYTLPIFAKMAKVPHWREALKQKGQLLRDPNKSWLLGASGASPTQQNRAATAQIKRSHHSPMTGK